MDVSCKIGSIQFDKLFRENSNRPSAAKSAGIVGKWGITSFTSIRSTNINGRRDDVHPTYGNKRAKLDYGNQNARVNSSKDPFSFDNEKTETAAVVKPKKFFKSRNATPTTTTTTTTIDETRPESITYRQVPESHYGRGRPPKQSQQTAASKQQILSKASSVAQLKKQQLHNEIQTNANQVPKDEGKPPIVLRICKGTARLICGDADSETDTYRISSSPQESPTKIDNNDRKSSPIQSMTTTTTITTTTTTTTTTSTDTRTTRSSSTIAQQPVVTTVSIPLDDSDTRRTTRSRAKNLRDIISPTTVIASTPPVTTATNNNNNTTTTTTTTNSHGSGLSLTLRKSMTDSNNTVIAHYDIVKTDTTNFTGKTQVEPLIGRDQPLPTTTQELIDILSSDPDAGQRNNNKQQPMETNYEEHEEIFEEILQYSEEPSTKQNEDDENENDDDDDDDDEELENESEPNKEIEEKELTPLRDDVPPTTTAKTIVDQDWFSGSEDSECATGNVENEIPVQRDEEIRVQPSSSSSPPPRNDVSITKPTTKKGSIFKSRSAGTTNSNKRRALYKHKWSDNDKESPAIDTGNTGNEIPNAASSSHADANTVAFEEFGSDELTRVVTYPEPGMDLVDDDLLAVTSIRCDKKVKGFYTVVKNVKKAHQIQESGEFQEFNDDVEYILDTLRENNPNATRCLSAIRLASKCMAPAFRMHVRAHGTVAKFFKALHDATKDQSLGLCTATVMFVLSQDRLAMDLDRDCLELMLSLLESDASHKDALDDCGLSRAELLKNKEKVRQLCADIQAQGHAKHLNLDNITVGQLAMETLLSLTSRRAGEWFKEELRELGGLEHIVKTIRDCHRHINVNEIARGWCDTILDKLRKVDRCLRVLENVTHMNEENQVYLLKYDNGVLVSTLASLYQLCAKEIPMYPIIDPSDKSSTGAVVRECLFAIIKVLINLTHRFNRQSFGSKTVGSQSGVLECSLYLLLRVPESIPEEKRFDMMMLALILLINLVEQCDDNKKMFIEAKAPSTEHIFDDNESGVEALIDLFYKQEELARAEEQKTDAILDGKKDAEQTETVSTTTKSQEEFIEETVTKLLQKAGRHMEHTLIGAYVVLLLGYLVMDNKDYETLVRSLLPDNTFSTMIAVLQKFFNFMNLTASNEVSSCGIAATEKVIKFLKMSDARTEEEKNELPLPALEESNVMLDMSLS
ncbi:protein wings apart-like isoform X2 [Leptopilina boulardi]|uniref:protein wings apart-like isoform X2 n=1 Tax=Leptopilina boulardi TaxID=63433 RepID=UPI0021F5A36F|nr:protein wings apart-like isoform X2 [Leptopilina boulardi]